MFTVKTLLNGKNAVYIKNDEDGRKVVAALLMENSRGLNADIRVRPLTSGRIAIYLNNDSAGTVVLTSLLKQVAPYSTELGDTTYPSKLQVDNVIPFGRAPHTWATIADGEFPY